MSRSVNEVTLIGNVGSDPEVRTTPSGTRIASVSLATSYKYKDNERTDWHRLKLFGRLVDVAEGFVRKGDRLYIRGRVEYSTSDDGHGGKKYWTDIIVNDLVMLGSAGGDKSDSPSPLPF